MSRMDWLYGNDVFAVSMFVLIILGAAMVFGYLTIDEEYIDWTTENEKICWEKGGDFTVGKFGIRCKRDDQILFNETYRPPEK